MMCGCLLCTPYWGPGPQHRHVPWEGIKPATFRFTGWRSIHWATPARIHFPFLLCDSSKSILPPWVPVCTSIKRTRMVPNFTTINPFCHVSTTSLMFWQTICPKNCIYSCSHFSFLSSLSKTQSDHKAFIILAKSKETWLSWSCYSYYRYNFLS